uniref:HAD-IA family hydrolase n=1 Tax=Marivivens sp. TaxID=1978374 RepID=UPI0025C4A4FF
AIASNGAIDKMRVTLTPYGLFDRLKDRMYSGHVQVPKPNAGMLIAAMKQANASPKRTFMIDDSTAGAGAAVAAGTHFIGYSEHGGAEKLKPLGVDIAYSMADLRARLVI